MLHDLWFNVTHNLFKPLLLFFYLGFMIPLLRVQFEYPKALYQSITFFLLVAIGWHGGEELAALSPAELGPALGFMAVGFGTNCVVGVTAYFLLRRMTRLRKVDAATVAGYYGSDSAGTFVTCVGVLVAAQIAYAPYMPVMLAVMEIPGCLVALLIVSVLRQRGMDSLGNMPGEAGYHPAKEEQHEEEIEIQETAVRVHKFQREGGSAGGLAILERTANGNGHHPNGNGHGNGNGHHANGNGNGHHGHGTARAGKPGFFSAKVLHEVFLNPGLFLLFGGILIGFCGRLQGAKITDAADSLFLTLFPGILCLFLLEMGITACSRLRDLRKAGWSFIAFGLLAPNLFAAFGIAVAHLYSVTTGHPLELGSYVLFAVLCGAASYIAMPAVQRMAIPEASPTLPLAASLGLTFTYNVTIGIPIYLELAKLLRNAWPVG